MEQDQKHSKTCTEAGMRSVQECWYGKESIKPSMKVRERDREVAEVRQRESDETHTCTKLPEPSLLIPQQPSQKLLCFPGANASHQRAITARLHSNTLQQYRCSAVVGR